MSPSKIESETVRAVAFDVDGTLYPNTSMYLRAILFALRRARFLRHFKKVREELRRRRPKKDLRRLQAELLGARLGVAPEEAEERIHRDIHGRWGRLLEEVRLTPNVADFVAWLRARGLKVGVLSDFPVDGKLERMGLDVPWDALLSSEEVGYLKPNPEPFLQLSRELGEDPSEILYVGNSYENDIEGAHAVGMLTAHFTRFPPRDSVATFSFSSFDALKAEIDGLVRKNSAE